MVYKKIKNEEGQYIDEKDVRFDILEANEAYTPEGLNVGWDEFENIESAATGYGLTYDPFSEEGE